ncbi:MAG: hypothetical protein EBS49_00490 [Verrucomicrobia bacterium]|nr:hypothetical protein [Verrucomicrobiota bacterium]
MAHFSMEHAIAKLREENPRFAPAAYHFVRRALDHSLRQLKRTDAARPAHVSGKELLEGFRDLALEEFGPMAKMVLEDWGVTRCAEVGEIVFQLVSLGVLGKSEDDRMDDFAELWSFSEAFDVPFRPRHEDASRVQPGMRNSPAAPTRTTRKRPGKSPASSPKG